MKTSTLFENLNMSIKFHVMDIIAIPCLDFWKWRLVSSNPISVYLGSIGEKKFEVSNWGNGAGG